MKLSAAGQRVIEAHEGRIPYVYDDAIYPTRKYVAGNPVRGTLTAGIGHANQNDVRQYIGKTVPASVIDAWFDADNDIAENAVRRLVVVKLSQPQFDALVSFVFNVGVEAFRTSTLLRKLNAGDYGAVPAQLARWNKTTISGKKVESDGLTKRRAAEAALWATGAAPAVETGTQGSPVAEADGQSIVTKESVLGAAGALGGLGSVLAGTGPVQWAFAVVMVAGFAIVAWMFLTKRLSPK